MATWTGSVLGGMTAAPYAGLRPDRLPERREDPGSVAALAGDPRARVVPLWRDQTPYFAVDLSDLGPDEALEHAGADAGADIRAVFADLPAAGPQSWLTLAACCTGTGISGFAVAAAHVAQSRDAGHLRACANAQCGTLMFPRIEPAIIALVETPAGLMGGFRAAAAEESVSVDGNEILEPRWFTREQLRDYATAAERLGRADSIDRIMLTAWLGNNGDEDTGAGEGAQPSG